ncbi:MAG: hypothetical protein R3C16_02750 [Hyphomonadaceae bacterium]
MIRSLVSVCVLALALPAFADEAPIRPPAPAPQADAPYAARAVWCRDYAAWVVTHMPAEEELPPDLRATHRVEVEMQSCTPDPQEYERVTIAELSAQPERPNVG